MTNTISIPQELFLSLITACHEAENSWSYQLQHAEGDIDLGHSASDPEYCKRRISDYGNLRNQLEAIEDIAVKKLNGDWICLPDGSWPNYQVNSNGDVRTLDGEIVPYTRPVMPDPTDDSEDTYILDGCTVGRYELIEAAFGETND